MIKINLNYIKGYLLIGLINSLVGIIPNLLRNPSFFFSFFVIGWILINIIFWPLAIYNEGVGEIMSPF